MTPKPPTSDPASRRPADADYYGRLSLFARAAADDPDVFTARTKYHRRLSSGRDLGDRIAELVHLAASVTGPQRLPDIDGHPGVP